jgi:two-component system sensor histidine kinase UhpB
VLLERSSLRTRVVALVGLVLLIGLSAGALLAGFEARNTLKAELAGGLTGARQTVATAFEDLPRSDHRDQDLRQLVAAFDGARHVRVSLVDTQGRTLAVSHVLQARGRAPGWFAGLLGRPPAPVRLPAPGARGDAILIEPITAPDVEAVWAEFSSVVLALGASAILGLALVYLAIGAALRPLADLSAGLARVGSGDYDVRVAERGASELAELERGFNAMAGRLAAMQGRNRLLEQQLLTLQDEERADLARDLHDEIGPHLFAVNIDAQMIGRLSETPGREAEIREQVKAIQAGVGHMQRMVRELLTRLRPTRATELGLKAALADLVAFWRARKPEVEFALEVGPEDGALPEPVADVIYRVVQESLNNAARHARARRVEVAVTLSAGEAVVRVSDDGEPQAEGADADPKSPGFGLPGMRERVLASGGALSIDREGGWTVTARLPLARRAETEMTA